ncbi:DUF7282 domain-containing protein [Halococcus saccharolyticus]|uniref:DUF7282 domain-containing protein n=1 Tax=Halococcus saccharolyticus TaxID=62319 RepID=UPI000AEED39D|nr:BGTF surface domain-containing protein [Halococcus saccharolyticus]
MTNDHRERAAGCWLAVLVILAAFGGVAFLGPASAQGTDVAANGTAAPTNDSQSSINETQSQRNGVDGTNETNASSATFNRSTVAEDRGDIAAIGINLSGVTETTVTVGSPAVNYETNVTVADGGNGQVTLLMNSYLAGTTENESQAYDTLAAEDSIVRTNRTTERLEAPLDTSTYNLSATVDGRETDTAALRLTERTSDELVTWTAPAESFDNVTNASEVAAAIENDRITTTDNVAVGDVLVLQSKLSGVYGAFEAANFTELVERGMFNLTVRQTNPGTNRQPKQLDLDRSLANDSIRVIPDPETDILYVNIDTEAAVFERGPPRPGDEFEAELTVREESSLAASNQSIGANVTAVGAELGLGDVSLAADDGQTVTGTTSIAPASEVTISLTANGTGSFVKTNTTTVSPNGTFATTFNLSETSPNTTVDVRAVGPLNTSDDITVPVRQSQEPAPMAGGARLAVDDQTTTGETVRIRNVTLADGGYVVIHAPNASEAPVESVLGTSSYLENGTAENVTVTLGQPLTESTDVVVMAHRDTNDNGVFDFVSSNGSEDGPYTSSSGSTAAGAETSAEAATATGAAASDSEPVATTVSVTVSNATTTGEVSDTTAVGSANGTNASGQPTSENGPGFGIVVATAAIVVAVVALGRRRE